MNGAEKNSGDRYWEVAVFFGGIGMRRALIVVFIVSVVAGYVLYYVIGKEVGSW